MAKAKKTAKKVARKTYTYDGMKLPNELVYESVPVVTVGHLIAQLQRLPSNLPVYSGSPVDFISLRIISSTCTTRGLFLYIGGKLNF